MKFIHRIQPLISIILFCFLMLHSAREGAAGKITVDFATDKDGNLVASISGDQTGRIVGVVPGDSGKLAGAGTTDSNGNAKITLQKSVMQGAHSVTITTEVPGSGKTETFEGVGLPGTYRSKEQSTVDANTIINSPVFAASGSSFFTDGTADFDQFSIVNSSLSTSFILTSLQGYTGLDASFFRPGAFDSAAAIATGHLVLDLVGPSGGGIPIFDGIGTAGIPSAAGSLALPTFTVSLPTVATFGLEYDLLIGEAAPILADGTLGQPVDFSLGSQEVPEPANAALAAIGILLVACRKAVCGGPFTKTEID